MKTEEERTRLATDLDTSNPKHQALFCVPSLIKLVEDRQKYGEYSTLPRCDRCGEEYFHFYIHDEIWPTELKGWICAQCFEVLTGLKIEKEYVMTFWENLFEVDTPLDKLDEILEQVDCASIGKSEQDFLLELVARIYSLQAAKIVEKNVVFKIEEEKGGRKK